MWSTLPWCLDESLRGHHHLFDVALVRRSFREPLELDPSALTAAKALFDELRAEEGLAAQRRRIGRAPERAQRLFVRLYFDYLADHSERVGRSVH